MNDASHGKTRFRVGGMDCASCATKIENAVSRLPGITEVGISVSAGTMTVSHQGPAPSAAISKQVKALGYPVAELGAARSAEANDHKHGPSASTITAMAATPAMITATMLGMITLGMTMAITLDTTMAGRQRTLRAPATIISISTMARGGNRARPS